MRVPLLSFRLGLERGSTAKEALDVIVALLDEHGQGGNYYEDPASCHSFQSAYLIVDREEAWVLETVGKYWAAEKITGEWVRTVKQKVRRSSWESSLLFSVAYVSQRSGLPWTRCVVPWKRPPHGGSAI